MTDLDTLLESGFQEAANRETFARQIEAKIKDIEGAEALIPARRYGEPVNAEKIRASLTLRSLIEAKSPQLAVYFGLDAGVAHRRAEEAEAAKLRAEVREDVNATGVDRQEMLCWTIHQLMAAAGEGVKNKQPSVTVGACRELDALLGLGYNSNRGRFGWRR